MNRRRLMWIRPLSCLRHTTMWAKLLLFWGCLSAAFVRSSVRPFVLLVRSCYHDISWTAWTISMDLIENNYWWPRDILKVKGQRLRSQQAVQVSKACTATLGRQSSSCSLLLLKVSVTTNYELTDGTLRGEFDIIVIDNKWKIVKKLKIFMSAAEVLSGATCPTISLILPEKGKQHLSLLAESIRLHARTWSSCCWFHPAVS